MKKVILAVVSSLVGIAGGMYIMKRKSDKVIQEKTDKVNKFKTYYNILNKWMFLKNEGKMLEEYFIKNNYRKIAIYGMGELGSLLYEELKGTEINVEYAIDSNPSSVNDSLEILSLENELPEVDAIIITPVYAFDDIEQKVQNVMDCPIISLEEVVFSIS